jgi:hypothetical protein
MKKYIALVLVSLSTCSFADSASFDLNDDAFRLAYQHGLSKSYDVDFAWTHVKNLGDSGSATLALTQELNNDLTAYIGGKAVLQQHDHFPEGMALAVGGAMRVTPASNKNFAIFASAYFAPDVLSFEDMENYQDVELRLEYKLSNEFTGYTGYRNNRVDYNIKGIKTKDVDLYDGFMIGAQFNF